MIWLIILSPLVGAILNGLLLPRTSKLLSHSVAVLAVLVSFIAALGLFKEVLHDGPQTFIGFNWLDVGQLHAPFEILVDNLSILLLLIITGIGTLIHVYAGGYMHDEEKTYRFFSYLNLFVFMMFLLVLGGNLLVMFVGWEGVGLCSYLLIGYWFQDKNNANAGMKAFIVNRIGDIGFLLGIFLTYWHFHTLNFVELKSHVLAHGAQFTPEDLGIIGLITLCLFIGACGKSAQLPLYVWLPDAMAGPTPVSALIHAATMVTAGVFMMSRMHFFYYLAPNTMVIVAFVGALTALFAATIAITQTDIKKVLAYSTVSQLGFMVLACGIGSFDAGVFHLLTHACFKALLFLGAGSVIYAMHHKQDMMEMGGLRKYMPMTFISFLIGVLAIIGFPGLSGFFSKDEILWRSFNFPVYGKILWAFAQTAALCTSFYMVRLLLLTFFGKNRSDHHTQEHLHETPFLMWGPLVILALLSIGVGYLGAPHIIAELWHGHNIIFPYLEKVISIPESAANHWAFLHIEHEPSAEWSLMGFSVFGAGLSACFALLLYRNGPSSLSDRLKKRFSRTHDLLSNKYWVDEIYHSFFVQPLSDISLFCAKVIDVRCINGFLNGVGGLIALISGITSFKMSGNLQRYALTVTASLLIFVFLLV